MNIRRNWDSNASTVKEKKVKIYKYFMIPAQSSLLEKNKVNVIIIDTIIWRLYIFYVDFKYGKNCR